MANRLQSGSVLSREAFPRNISVDEIRVLLVDDVPSLSKVTGEFLVEQNPAITYDSAASGSEALDLLDAAAFDIVVSDYDMPGMDGLELLAAVRAEYPDLPFILFTGKGSEEIASEAISAGVTDYLQKGTGTEQYELLANRITNAVVQTKVRQEYHETQVRFQALTENAPFVVVTIDETSTIRYVNDSVRDVLGYDPSEVVGESLVALMPDRFEDAHRAGIEQYLRTGDRNLDWSWIELPGLHADGHEVLLGVTFGELADGDSHLFTGIIRDITEQKHVEAERELLNTTIRAAAEAETLHDGLQAVIRETCERFGWAYGEAWVPDGDHLDRTNAAYTTSDAFEPFAAVSAVTEFGPGEGLPGRAWSREESVWMPNVSALTADVFPRVEAAAAVGLKAALGVPIRTDDGVVAVLAFYMAEEKEEDERLVDAVTTVATELGELMERKQQTDELERLNRLNVVTRNVVAATLEAESRAEIESMVCERLAAEETVAAAWVGETDRANDLVSPRTAVGVDVDELEASTVARDARTGDAPTGRAATTGEVEVLGEVSEPWLPARQGATGGYWAVAVPLVHEERDYGVLTLYTTTGFGSRERSVLGELGRMIGKAMTALEQRDALLSDRVVELQLRVAALAETFRGIGDDESAVEISAGRIVTAGARSFQYFSATGVSTAELVEAFADYPNVTDVEVLDGTGDACRVKVILEGRTLAKVLADNGGRVISARYTDGEFRITAESPYSVDIRQVLDAVETVHPGVELLSQRGTRPSSRPVGELQSILEEQLTDQQRAALELARYSGYFEWPRKVTAEELAETMDISSPTFHQHLRAGERKLMEIILEEQAAPR